jgi:hypothetical protein
MPNWNDFKNLMIRVVGIEEVEKQEQKANKLANLLLNMSDGLLPEYLSQDEVELLKEEYGENWFEELGYNELKYKKSKF